MMLVVVLGCRLKMFFLAHGDFFRVYVVGHVFVFHAAVGAWCVCVCVRVCVCVCVCVLVSLEVDANQRRRWHWQAIYA